jgi:hypothetical protein
MTQRVVALWKPSMLPPFPRHRSGPWPRSHGTDVDSTRPPDIGGILAVEQMNRSCSILSETIAIQHPQRPHLTLPNRQTDIAIRPA